MAQGSYSQSSFMSGEWSQTMQGRADHSEYRKAMSTCLNGVVTETEAWSRRPGSGMSGATRQGKPARVIKFEFEESFPYTMEFTDGFLRFWAGSQRVTANDSQAIAAISGANPAVITTALPHGWSTGNTVFASNLGTVAPLLQGRTFIITVIDTTHFSIVDELTGASINGATLGYTGGGTINRILEIPTPYTAGSWQSLRVVQAEEQALLLNGTQPQLLQATQLPGATGFAQFALTPALFQDGPYLDPIPESVATPSGEIGNITLTLSFQAYLSTFSYSLGDYVTASGTSYQSLQGANLNNTPASSPTFWKVVSGGAVVNNGAGFVPSDIGRLVRLFSEPALWSSVTAYVSGNVVSYNTLEGVDLYYVAIANSTNVIPGTDVTKWVLVAGQQYAAWTWGRIIAVSGAGAIAGNLAGSTQIGNMTFGGGLAAAFNGNTSQPAAASAEGSGSVTDCYVGKNYSGASAQQIAQATVYPSTDFGFYNGIQNNNKAPLSIVLNLRAKATAPTAPNDGTLLGTSGPIANTMSPVTILSNNSSTAWNFVWIEIAVSGGITFGFNQAIAQAIFYNPNVNNGSVATVQIAGAPLLYGNAVRTWQLGVYSNTTGWPTCGCYHEGRIWLGGAVDNRFDACEANGYPSFSPTEVDGTVTDANGISYTLNASDVNPIFWMLARQEGIICGTQGGEWLIQATTVNAPLTPTSIQAHRYTVLKCANIEPVLCEHTMAFVQKHQRRMLEYFTDIFSGKFAAPNLTYKSQHITTPGIAEIRYQQDTIPVIWMRTNDNLLSGVTYKRDSLISRDGPTVCAHHRHILGSNRQVVSITVGAGGSGGTLESLSMVTFDGTYYYVEILGQLFDEKAAVTTAQFLDACLPGTSYSFGTTGVTINGLWLLNGQTVSVFVAGVDCGQQTVVNGSITVLYGDGVTGGTGNGQFTQTLAASFGGALPIVVGFPYASQGQVLPPDAPQESGARMGPAFGKAQKTHRVVAKVVNTVSGYLNFGTTFTKMLPAIFRTRNGPVITGLFTGVYKETAKDYSDEIQGSALAWQVSGPFPCTVARLAGFVTTEDE